MNVSYLIPEFPGQTHIWMWREIVHLRNWGVDVRLISTRPPIPTERARHAFADETSSHIEYLYDWRHKSAALRLLLQDTIWAACSRPWRFIQSLTCAARLACKKPAAAFKVLRMIPLASRLARLLATNGANHLHVHSFGNSSLLAILAKRLTGIAFSQTLNAHINIWGGFEYEKLHEAMFTIAITNQLMEEIRQSATDLSRDRYVLGRIGVDTSNWPALWTPHSPGEPFRIITVGRLHPVKGHDDLIRAVASLVDQGIDIVLTILGDGPQRDELELLTKTLSLASRVTFLGSVSESEIKRQMQSSHCFVGASHCETLGVVFMEAMAAGLPTIGTAGGGLPEIIDHQQNGILVPPKNAAALSSAIRQLFENDSLCRLLSQNARKRICAEFDSERGAKTLFDKLTPSPA